MRMGHEIPPRATPSSDNGYLEEMTRAVFQSGFSWAVIRDKWPNFIKAFDEFDVDAVAEYGEDDLERLLSNTDIVRKGVKWLPP